MSLFNVLQNRIVFLSPGLVDDVIQVLPNTRFVRRNHHHIHPVNFVEFRSFRFSGTCHPRQLLIHSEIVLNGDCCVGLRLLFDRNPFLGFNSLMKTIAPTPSGHQTTRVFIHDHHLTVLNDILDVLLIHTVSPEKLADTMDTLADPAESLLCLCPGFFLLLETQARIRIDLHKDAWQIRHHKGIRISRTHFVATFFSQVRRVVAFLY
ncbi:MAG: hypothetical protein BWY82_02158 [Verrucomicrobia bacterium ADurb.Bin474]|nr:MAG: hypothetical protein BWY82_02158 [Verrucomicrobia bacterium ADurb.Bin474]